MKNRCVVAATVAVALALAAPISAAKPRSSSKGGSRTSEPETRAATPPALLDAALMYEALDPGVASLAPVRLPCALFLDECVRKALAGNRLLSASAHGVDAGDEGVRKARAAFLGQLNFLLSRIKYNDQFSLLAGRAEATAKGLTYDLPIWTGGALDSSERSAELRRTLARLDDEKTRQEVAYAVTQAYFLLIEAQWLGVLGREHVRQMELQRDLVQARIEEGAAVESERLRVDVALEDARAQLVRFQNLRGRAEAALNLAMGRGIQEPAQALEPRAMRRLDETLAQGFARAAVHRPELLAAQASARLEREKLVLARAGLQPTVGFQYSYGANSPLFAGDEPSSQFLLSSTWPLWDGGGRQAEVHRAAAAYQQERDRVAFYEQQVQLEMTQAFLDVTDAQERITVTRRGVAAALENARITAERYRQGAAIVLELVDSELTLLGARTSLLKAVVDYGTALATYLKATGDLWPFFGGPKPDVAPLR